MVLVAHNLRTPVTVIQGYLSLLSEMEIPEIQKELVEPIGEASQNLYLLIEQILTITTVLGQRDLVISKEKLKLSDIIANIIKEYQSKIEEKKLSVSQNYIPKNINIFANRRYIELIFMALIENAIKFNKAGGAIKIDGKLEGDNTILAISDTGIGIAKTEQDRVFAGFHKADTHESVYDFNYKGTGLGLYTSKILVDAFGGNIWFESDEGKCSTFYISLPNFQEPSSKQSTNTAQNDTASQIN
jgi:signal transduction histidine kinase